MTPQLLLNAGLISGLALTAVQLFKQNFKTMFYLFPFLFVLAAAVSKYIG